MDTTAETTGAQSVLQLATWVEQAACVGLPSYEIESLFYPRDGLPVPEETLEMCQGCPVQAQCLKAGLEGRYSEGVWGGVDMREVNGRPARARRRAAS